MLYQEMTEYWAVIDSVKSGTPAVRKKGSTFLPLEPLETPEAYARRLSRANLTPWYTRLVRGLIGLVLRKPIALEVSEQVRQELDNINLLGDDLNTFSREVFESAIDYGYAGVLVDYTRMNEVQTLAEEVEQSPRPYWIHYSAQEILSCKYAIANHRQVFSQLRLLIKSTVPDGEFGEKEIEQVKVYDLDRGWVRWRLFEEVERDRWEVVEAGYLTLPFIPFALVRTSKKKNGAVQPPMLEVAFLNISHLQTSSDLDHALHVAANPKLCIFGYNPENGDILSSVDEALVFENPDARAEWIAPPPASFRALEKRIDKLEMQMAVLGLSTLTSQKNVGESADAKRLDRTQGDSIMAVVSQGLQDALDLCLEYHAAYRSEDAGTCQVNRDYEVGQLSSQAIATFSALHDKNQISLETLLGLLKRGEVFNDEFSIEQELSRLASLKPPEPMPTPST